MILKIKDNDSEFFSLKNEWSQLLSRSFNPSLTQSWEWMNTWWSIYGRERNLSTLCFYENGHLVGMAPLSVGKKKTTYYKVLKYKTAWFLGSGKTKARGVVSDYLDFIAKQGNEEQIVDRFLQYMSKSQVWDEIILQNISAESTSPKLLEKFSKKYCLNFKITDRIPSILIKLPESWDQYLNSISSSTRYKINRGRKELKKIGGAYRRINNESELPQAFSDLEKLHQHRWRSKGIYGAFSSIEWKSFHEKLMPLLLKKNQLRLSFLDVNNQPRAANYSFAFDQKLHFFQSGMIPHQNKHVRLGLLLHSFCIEEAIKEGFTEYDFLSVGASGAGYKSMWGNHTRDLLTIRISKTSNKENIYNFLIKISAVAKKIRDKTYRNLTRSL